MRIWETYSVRTFDFLRGAWPATGKCITNTQTLHFSLDSTPRFRLRHRERDPGPTCEYDGWTDGVDDVRNLKMVPCPCISRNFNTTIHKCRQNPP